MGAAKKKVGRSAWHHGDLRRALLDASLSVVNKRGIAALSLRDLARRAGVSAGAPYHHFASREELLLSIAEEGFALLSTMMVAGRDASGADPCARLEGLGKGYVQFALTHRGHFRVMFRPEVKRAARPQLRENSGYAFELLQRCVADCQAAGLAPQCPIERLVLTAWSAVHGVASLWIDGPLEGAPGSLGPDGIGEAVAGTVARLFAEAGPRRRAEAEQDSKPALS